MQSHGSCLGAGLLDRLGMLCRQGICLVEPVPPLRLENITKAHLRPQRSMAYMPTTVPIALTPARPRMSRHVVSFTHLCRFADGRAVLAEMACIPQLL